MRKKGGAFLGIVLAIFMFTSGILILPFVSDDVSSFRVGLNCSNGADITNGTKLTCLFGGALVPYFIWFVFSLAIGLIVGGIKS